MRRKGRRIYLILTIAGDPVNVVCSADEGGGGDLLMAGVEAVWGCVSDLE